MAPVEKNNPLFVQGKCFNSCEAALTIGENNSHLYVCMDYLAQLSEYFRAMFFGDFKEKELKQFEITDETPEDMICFFNAISPDPNFRKITDDLIEVLMRLADKFQCDLLKERLKRYIEKNEPDASIILNWLIWSIQYHMPEETIQVCTNVEIISDDSVEMLMRLADEYRCDLLKDCLMEYIEINEPTCKWKDALSILNWFLWSLQYHMPREAVEMCLPGMACLPLDTLYANQEKIGLDLFTKLLDAKRKLNLIEKEFCKRKLFLSCYNHNYYSSSRTPYKIFWCKGNEHLTFYFCDDCWKAGKDIYSKCCEKSDIFFKCGMCQLDPWSYENKDQCLCARKNYEFLFNNAS